MQPPRPIQRALSLLVGVAILLTLMAGDAFMARDAFAAAKIRLLHAVSGVPEAQLRLSAGQLQLEGVGFGEATQYGSAPAGRARLELLARGRRLAATGDADFQDGRRYTVVAAGRRGSGAAQLRVYRDGRATAGEARLRVVAAAPEVTRAQLTLDGRSLATLSSGEASGYATRDPGTYRLAAVRPGSDDELASSPDLSLVAGTAATAYVIGSAGERTRFVVLQDAAAAPTAGPASGLGGVAGGGRSWLLALLAAAAAGAAGGLLYWRASGRAGG